MVAPPALKVATSAVLRLLTLCGIGMGYAKVGILDPVACSTLSRLIYYVFQPMMLFLNCATTIAASGDPRSLLALPMCAAAQILVGALFGSAALACLGPREGRAKFLASTEARELRALCAFGNAGPLPFVFAQGFFREDPVSLAKAVAYISFYLVGWSPLFWTIGPTMLQSSKQRRSLSRVLSPPVLASLSGVAVGFLPCLHFLLSGPLAEGIRLLGAAYLPAVALVLAGTLARSVFGSIDCRDDDPTLSTIKLPVRLALLGLCRFVALPLASLGLLQLPLLRDTDPILRFVVFMASAMPSAQNAIVILQLDQDAADAAAPSMARILALLYISAIVPMAILLSLAAQLAPLPHLVNHS